jgi:N-acetylneuraminic acid mutarotase
MTRLPLTLALALPVIALAACSEDATTPTAPGDQLPRPSLALGSNTWIAKAALPAGPSWLATGMVYDAAGNSIVYAFGGIVDGFPAAAIQAYSLATNKWTAKTSTVYYFDTNGVGKIGSRLYFTGGYDTSSDDPFAFGHTFAYDYANDRLIKKADMPKATGEGVTGVISNKLYVLPGACSGNLWPNPRYCENENIKTFYRYDPSTNTWTTRASAPHYHRKGAAGVINGKFYVVGGSNGVGASAALDVYDPTMNTWKTLASLPTPTVAASGAVVGNKLLVVSWFNNGGASPAIRTYSYDPATNKWTAKPSPPNLGSLTRVALNGKSYVLSVGGSGECCDFESPSQLYTP